MPSQFKQDNPGCDCCGGFVCDDCSALTYFTISGLNSGGNCTSGCEGRNGTYVFRTVGSYFTTGADLCGWANSFLGDNCGATGDDFAPFYYTGNGACSSSLSNWGIGFQPVGGLIRIRVGIALDYEYRTATLGGTYYKGRYSALYQDDFASCAAAVGATLPQVSTSSSICDIALAIAPDICDLLGATITLG